MVSRIFFKIHVKIIQYQNMFKKKDRCHIHCKILRVTESWQGWSKGIWDDPKVFGQLFGLINLMVTWTDINLMYSKVNGMVICKRVSSYIYMETQKDECKILTNFHIFVTHNDLCRAPTACGNKTQLKHLSVTSDSLSNKHQQQLPLSVYK